MASHTTRSKKLEKVSSEEGQGHAEVQGTLSLAGTIRLITG